MLAYREPLTSRWWRSVLVRLIAWSCAGIASIYAVLSPSNKWRITKCSLDSFYMNAISEYWWRMRVLKGFYNTCNSNTRCLGWKLKTGLSQSFHKLSLWAGDLTAFLSLYWESEIISPFDPILGFSSHSQFKPKFLVPFKVPGPGSPTQQQNKW